MFYSFRRKKENLSVLNTDRFDKRRFKQIYNMSKSLKEMEQVEEIPLFKELLSDIWASLYKVNPKIKEELPSEQLVPNKTLMNKIMSDKSYNSYHESTKLDDLLSAVGTVNFGNQTKQWIEEMKQEHEELNDLINQINQLSQHIDKENDKSNSNEQDNQEEANGNSDNQNNDQKGDKQEESNHEHEMDQLMNQLAKQLQELSENGTSFGEAMANAVKETEESTNNLEKLFGDIGGKQAGSSEGSLRRLPLRNKIELAEMLSKDQKVKRIAEWAGKFTRIAQSKQKTLREDSVGVGGIEQGDMLEKVLPSELMLYANKITRHKFFKKHSERTLRQYKPRNKEKLGKGSIILCLDQSGSMYDDELESKGFALAIMAIARKQKRNFAYIPFSNSVGEVKIFQKGKIKPDELVKLAKEFISGGTNFLSPLKESIKIIEKDRFKDADIIFITDGSAPISNSFLKKFHIVKKEKEFSVMSLILGDHARKDTVEMFSDKVIKAENLHDENSYEIFKL